MPEPFVQSALGDSGASNLIIDVGAHNGDDTAYYLSRGYSVVSVEANPTLAKELRVRFAGSQVRVENVCIGPGDPPTVKFWINQSHSTWSSFHPELASRSGTVAVPVEVPCVTMGALLGRYGIPHYLKIDIEGMDEECLKTLDPKFLPKFISLELSNDGEIIKRLRDLGYERFKVLNQGTYTTAAPIFSNDFGWRILRKLRAGSLVPDGHKQDFDLFLRKFDWEFKEGCSGPFGEETFGTWLSSDDAERLHARIQRAYVRGGASSGDCWYDVHATV